MSNFKNQHFVPKHYFRKFSNDPRKRRINLVLRNSGEIIIGASINGQASANNFYGNEDMEIVMTSMESMHRDALSSIEDWASSLGNTPTEYNWSLALGGILFQRVRTDLEREKSADSASEMMTAVLKEKIKREASLGSKTVRQNYMNNYSIQVDKKAIHGMKLISGMRAPIVISDLERLAIVNHTSIPFTFSDSPVVFYNIHLRNVKNRGVVGFQSPGLIIYYPLNPMVAILLIDGNKYKHHAIDNHIEIHDVDEIINLNSLQLHNSSNALYFGNSDNSHDISLLWNRESSSLSSIRDKLIIAPGYLINGKPLGNVYHMHEPQIEYKWLPRFLSYSVAEGTDSQNFIRSPRLVRIYEDMIKNDSSPFWDNPPPKD